jgi:hypothetical protein
MGSAPEALPVPGGIISLWKTSPISECEHEMTEWNLTRQSRQKLSHLNNN